MLTRRSSDAAGAHHTVTRTVTGRMHARNSPAQSIPIPVTVHIQSRTEYVYPDVSSFPVPTVVYMLTLVNTPLLTHLKNRLCFLITESVSCLQGREVRSVRFCGWCGKAGCGDEKKSARTGRSVAKIRLTALPYLQRINLQAGNCMAETAFQQRPGSCAFTVRQRAAGAENTTGRRINR